MLSSVHDYTSNRVTTSGRLKSQGSETPVLNGGELGDGNLSLKQNLVSPKSITWSLDEILISNS